MGVLADWGLDSFGGEWIVRIKSLKTLMGLTLWGRGGHLRCAKEKHDLFGLVCGGVLVPSLACIVVNLSDEAGLWQA